jgi:hypothetical protein
MSLRDNGDFEVRGTPAMERFRITFFDHLVVKREPVEFQRGTTGLSIDVSFGRELAASALLPEPMTSGSSLLSQLELQDNSRASQPWLAHYAGASNGRCQLQWRAVPVGTYTLSIGLWAGSAPLVRIPDVMVPPPPGGDPRLADIDLREVVRLVTLHLRDATGAPIEHPTGFVRANPPGPGDHAQFLGLESDVRVAVLRDQRELVVALHGYRPRTISLLAEEVEVRFDAWPEIAVSVTDAPPLPEGVLLLAQLRPLHGHATTHVTSAGELGIDYTKPYYAKCQFEDGVARPSIDDGPHELLLELTQDWLHYARLRGTQPAQVLPTVTAVTVTVPAEAWAEALAELQKTTK